MNSASRMTEAQSRLRVQIWSCFRRGFPVGSPESREGYLSAVREVHSLDPDLARVLAESQARTFDGAMAVVDRYFAAQRAMQTTKG